jgi:hypothetical protein
MIKQAVAHNEAILERRAIGKGALELLSE